MTVLADFLQTLPVILLAAVAAALIYGFFEV